MTKRRSPLKRRARTPSRDNLPPVLAVVGRGKTGKTTLIERLIRALAEKGYSVATIKDARGGFEVDLIERRLDLATRRPGKSVARRSCSLETNMLI
jgi:molybdopterin-guanine dinucleotide biosynthesis protein